MSFSWEVFAPDNLGAEFARSHFRADNTVRTPSSPLERIGHILTAYNNNRARQTKFEELIARMRTHLRGKLASRSLTAYGFPVEPSPDRTPRRIRPEFWETADIEWPSDIAFDDFERFRRIKIIDPRNYPEAAIQPKIGRKTFKPLIYSGIRGIMHSDPEFPKKSNKLKIELVRNFIQEKCPEIDPYGNGLRDDAIRKHISEFLSE